MMVVVFCDGGGSDGSYSNSDCGVCGSNCGVGYRVSDFLMLY
jgi:hypothetical protein